MTYKYVQLEATTSKKVATGLYLFRVRGELINGIVHNRFDLMNPDTLKVVYTSGAYTGGFVSQLSDKEFLVLTMGNTRHRIRFI